MICVIGKTCSGKDTIVNKLISSYGYKKLITHTSRPMRDGEKQDATYHFISTSEFQEKILEGFFAEWKVYNTEFGDWYYGVALEDLEKADDNTVIILTPEGYREIASKLQSKPKAIYIYADNETIKERLIARGDDKNEAERRLEHDNEDFEGIENEVDKIFYNNRGTDINEVVDTIVTWLK